MRAADIRETFLKFFEKYHHQRVKSSALIPAADPTLLFTNAGMVQFKDAFLGLHDPGYRRATTCQKCVRAGGKHNDLENVGYTARHHTFFEMLGNFSFGDYFKSDAIAFAWELLTRYFHLPKERLRITVFEKDDEALELWKAQGVPPERIGRLGEKDNFWAMGETGPCGPCTEIHFDWGENFGCKKPGCAPGCDCGRFLEIWNLVFMQFNRDAGGKMAPLPKPSVDTGAGLERLASVLQGVFSNYDTDLFQPILQAIASHVGKKYARNEEESISMRVIADHLRAGTFLLSDGVTPSNEGRGYVLRRILRRAIRHGKKLGGQKPFLYQLVGSVVATLGDVYPEIRKNQKIVEVMLREEEERFHETLHRGMGLLEETIRETTRAKQGSLSGEVAFRLYDTYGFPLDLIEGICREQGLTVDLAKFDELMEKQRGLSTFNRGGTGGYREAISKALESKRWETRFVGYEALDAAGNALMIFSAGGEIRDALKAGEEGFAIFDSTPFYAESGGQIGDKGRATGSGMAARVESAFKIGKTFVHRVVTEEGELRSGVSYALRVDPHSRKLTAINHTATHMLHAALRQVLGDRVKQAGSLVEPARLRFDFTFPKPLSESEIEQVERIINEQIHRAREVSVKEMDFDEAMKSGALAFFDEKYGDRVRVVRVGETGSPFSVELCGGTHLDSTSEIGLFKVLSESSVASGVRRIEAITSESAIHYLTSRNRVLETLERMLGTRGDLLARKIDQMLSEMKTLQREKEKLQLSLAQGAGHGGDGGGQSLWEKKKQVKDLQVVADQVPSVNPKILRSLVDQVRDKLKERTVIFLASEADGKAFLCVGLTKDLVGRWDAAKIIQPLAEEVGGSGGGRGDFAQAGGNNPGGLKSAFDKFEAWLRQNV